MSSASEPDPFHPPDESVPQVIELAATSPRRAVPLDVPEPVVQGPKTVTYKRPMMGPANLVLFTFALVGLVTCFVLFTGFLKKSATTPAGRPQALLARPEKPTKWRGMSKDAALLLTVETVPRGAQLFWDGAPFASNPARLPMDGQLHKVSASADGYEPGQVEVKADGSQTVRLVLKRRR